MHQVNISTEVELSVSSCPGLVVLNNVDRWTDCHSITCRITLPTVLLLAILTAIFFRVDLD